MKEIIHILNKYHIHLSELDRYKELHRHYHNLVHIITMIDDAKKLDIISDELLLAIIFHDIIYDPKSSQNEEQSAELFYSYIEDDNIKKAIIETKNHNPTTKLSKQLCYLDLKILYDDFDKFKEYEEKIRKEFYFVDVNIYKEKRVEILIDFKVKPSWI